MHKSYSIAILTTSILLAASCQQRKQEATPTIEPVSESVYASGVVRSSGQYSVYPATSGLIEDILVREGDVVKKGDPLITLVNVPARLNELNSMLAADYASLKSNEGKLRELKVSIDLAAQKLKNDSLLAARQQRLWSQNIGTLLELEQRELAYQNAQTQYEVARIRYDDLKRQLEYNSKQSQTNLKISTSRASDYVVRAEADGKVYKILKEKGELASAQSPVAIVGDAINFYLELTVDEYDIARIREGQRVIISMDSYSGEVFEGKVTHIEPLMNEQSRSFTVNAEFISRPELLYPNLSLEANIIIRAKESAMTIPRNYLIGDTLVIMKNGDKRKVQVGLKDYRKAEIVSGLSAGEFILSPNP